MQAAAIGDESIAAGKIGAAGGAHQNFFDVAIAEIRIGLDDQRRRPGDNGRRARSATESTRIVADIVACGAGNIGGRQTEGSAARRSHDGNVSAGFAIPSLPSGVVGGSHANHKAGVGIAVVVGVVPILASVSAGKDEDHATPAAAIGDGRLKAGHRQRARSTQDGAVVTGSPAIRADVS